MGQAEVPQKLKQFADIVYTIYLLILDQYVSLWGLNDPFKGLSLNSPCLALPLLVIVRLRFLPACVIIYKCDFKERSRQ